jgi:NADPH:quinone reductase-like Zn-dependent oxidoreductase
MAPQEKRERAWRMLAEHLKRDRLAAMTKTHSLQDLPALAQEILAGKIAGRVVIRIE